MAKLFFKWLLLLSFIPFCAATQKTLKIAVIDTGLDLNDPRFKDILCPYGHEDFTGKGLNDNVGHGTHVVGLIKQYAEDSVYCLVILKYFDANNRNEIGSPYINALLALKKNNIDVVNLSSGGKTASPMERSIIKENSDITFIIAAGNDGSDLDKDCSYYPACYNLSNIITVGNLNGQLPNDTSNYGNRVMFWEQGTNVVSTLPDNKEGEYTGTSMACAVHTGKLIKERYHAK